MGKTVTVRGDTAYSRSRQLPLVLLGLGTIFLIVPARWVAGWAIGFVHARRRDR